MRRDQVIHRWVPHQCSPAVQRPGPALWGSHRREPICWGGQRAVGEINTGSFNYWPASSNQGWGAAIPAHDHFLAWAFIHQGLKDCKGRARGHGLQSGDSTELGTDAQKQMGWGAPWLPRKPLLGSMHSTLQARLPPGCSSQLSQGAWGWGVGQTGGCRAYAHSSLGKIPDPQCSSWVSPRGRRADP